MKIPFPFESLLVFGFLSVMLLAGIALRARVPVLQRFLFPSCLIGGVLGLILVSTGIVKVETSLLETFAFHFFNISFISVGLTPGNRGENHGKGKSLLRGPLWMALIEGVTLPLQAVVGGPGRHFPSGRCGRA
ncbi:MAG: hypothetical protein JRJ83_18185 [Deltaproteobacteria bacterium]|nr:hypothetical protein [Deltaproteobacteria bacterium]